jgi:thiol-disulfide isomerase/thioredoxin
MSDQPVHDPEPQPPAPGTPVTQDAPSRPSRKTAWLAMGAVALALGLLMFIPDEHYDPNAPPPAADGATAEDDGGALLVGKPAPLNFTLKDMNGVDVQLASFKGKVIVLNFWATWCGPCKVEIPDLVSVQNEYRDDLVVLGVSVDDTPDKMKPYAEQYKINYPLLVGNGRDDVQDAYGPLWGIPVSVFIDREGKIAKKHSGIATREQFLREITPLIGGRGAADDL